MGGECSAYGLRLFIFTFSVLVCKIQGCCTLNSEGLALFQFRAKVEVDPFGALANWNPNDCDPCMWSGIECLEGKVVMLNQSGRDLEGVLAAELGNLTHLRILDLSKNHLSGTIPPQFGQLMTLEVLDLRDNSLSGTVPSELGKLHSLKRLLLCNNTFEGSIPVEIGDLSFLSDFQFDDILSTAAAAAGIQCINRKFGPIIWQNVLKQVKKSDLFNLPLKWSLTHYLNLLSKFKLGNDSSQECANDSCGNQAGVIADMHEQTNNARRVLAEQPANLVSLPPNVEVGAPAQSGTDVSLPSSSSGSFPALPNEKKPYPVPVPSPTSGHENMHHDSQSPSAVAQPNYKEASRDGNFGGSLKLILLTSIAILLLIVATIILLIYRKRAKTIIPWKTGLSGQLQKAFVIGVPKLNRSELEAACEDFSNIVYIREGVATLYKGTLSSGVEIAVASSSIAFRSKWSKCAEISFRKEIDSLSRVNHKNFVNLIGYCEEDEPFTRMLVYEYAPNGTLFEHLHDKELEPLDWNARMRIIMGVAYCLTHMHELNPAVVHTNLTSKEIYLTDDYAAKIADVSFWMQLASTSKNPAKNELKQSELPPFADVETNVHSFGILILEIISGRLPYSGEQGNTVNWADSYLNDKSTMNRLIDPRLKSFSDNQLNALCKTIQSCAEKDPRKRPSMTEVIQQLRQALNVSPEEACPRLSPLWWAELEILSSEGT